MNNCSIMGKIFIPLFLLLVSFCVHAEQLELLRAIENPDFVQLCGVVASGNDEFIVVDGKQNKLMRLDWDGNLLGTLARKGRGPGELAQPWSVSRYLDKILVLDLGNARIFETDTRLTEPRLYKLRNEIPRLAIAIDDDHFLCEQSFRCGIGGPRLYLRDKHEKTVRSFFTKCAIDPKKFKNIDKAVRISAMMMAPVAGVDHENGRILVTFSVPDNPMPLYLYSLKGDYISEFNHPLWDDYQFPIDLPKTLDGLKGGQTLAVRSIFWHQNRWFVFVTQWRHKDVAEELTARNIFKNSSATSRCILFSPKGLFISQFDFDFEFIPTDLTPQGLLLGISKDGGHKHPASFEDTVLIYRFHPDR